MSATDLEDSLRRQLEPVLGNQISRPVLRDMVERILYENATRRVAVKMRDGSALEYVLARPARPGVKREAHSAPDRRVARITRILALAIRLKQLTAQGVVGSYREIAQLGHISRPRMSQIMGLTELAPAIQEELLFLPGTVQGRDRIHEKQLRRIAAVVDWEEQRRLFRLAMDAPPQRWH